VTEAATDAAQAATQTGEDGWKVVAEELRGLRGDITKLMEGAAKAPVQAAETAVETPPTSHETNNAEPNVQIEKPKPPERKVRRGGRKVVRRG
jgi:hypothetical protein